MESQSGAATAIRVYKHGDSDLATLIAAIDGTLSSFGDDMDDLREFSTELEPLLALSKADQRTAVMVELSKLDQALDDRLGEPGRRKFWF